MVLILDFKKKEEKQSWQTVIIRYLVATTSTEQIPITISRPLLIQGNAMRS